MFLALLHLGLKPPCLYQDCLLEAILPSALALLYHMVPVAAVSVPCCPGSSLALSSFPPPTCQHHDGPSLLPALGPHFPAPPKGSATRCRYPSAALLPSFESITLPQMLPWCSHRCIPGPVPPWPPPLVGRLLWSPLSGFQPRTFCGSASSDRRTRPPLNPPLSYSELHSP